MRERGPFRRLLAAAVLLSFASGLPADEIVLKNGEVLRGRIVKEKADFVVFEQGKIQTDIFRDQIKEIRKGGTGPVAPGPAAKPPPKDPASGPPPAGERPAPAAKPPPAAGARGLAGTLEEILGRLSEIPTKADPADDVEDPREFVKPEEAEKGSVKIQAKDGSAVFQNRLPADDSNADAVWKADVAPEAWRDEGGFAIDPVPGKGTHRWNRQFWIPEEKAWTAEKPTAHRIRRERGILEEALLALYGVKGRSAGEAKSYGRMIQLRAELSTLAYQQENVPARIRMIQEGRVGGDETKRAALILEANGEWNRLLDEEKAKWDEIRRAEPLAGFGLPDAEKVGEAAALVARLHVLTDRRIPTVLDRLRDLRAPGRGNDAIERVAERRGLEDKMQELNGERRDVREKVRDLLAACREQAPK